MSFIVLLVLFGSLGLNWKMFKKINELSDRINSEPWKADIPKPTSVNKQQSADLKRLRAKMEEVEEDLDSIDDKRRMLKENVSDTYEDINGVEEDLTDLKDELHDLQSFKEDLTFMCAGENQMC
mmetsp:Transcript_4123/g.6141  ORF Transcript_4123/g.6141 Transcript_4123/m.6141 type:complete len:124 (+) Transcript_4123:755-1126(+)